MANSENYRIEEFKSLRDEVKRCETESLKITLYVFTGVILAASIAERSSLPTQIIPILLQAILIWGMQRFHALSSIRLRLSTYILVMIEPEIEGLDWETRNNQFNSKYYNKYYFSNVFISWCVHNLGHLFFLLTLIGFLVSYQSISSFSNKLCKTELIVFIAILLFLHIISSLLMFKCVFLKPKDNQYIHYWREIKEL